MYIENPKTKGSGIIGAIPQTGTCPNKCEDCFFQSGRSYLEPLEENLPNYPSVVESLFRVVRINDGNDSDVQRETVMGIAEHYPMYFYNTAIPKDLEGFNAPVVLTVNPGKLTDKSAYYVDPIPENLMFVRFRANTWNIELAHEVVSYYSEREVPIILTFMRYYKKTVKKEHESSYIFRKSTLNSYWAITTSAWEYVMSLFKYNKWVYSCGKIEGEKGTTACRHCGNCLREYFATIERMRKGR